jgi:hypothetical protein
MHSPRWPAAIALVLVLAGTVRIASTWLVFNHTIDEPDTLAAGMEYLSTGRFLYEDVHPPLGRVVSAIGPFLAGERFHRGPDSYSEGYRILGHGDHYDRTLALSRAGTLIFFWIASIVVYQWGWFAGGPIAAVIATLLFTTLPPILAHAGLATTDFALCAMTAAATLAALHWAGMPSRRRSVWLGLLTALAFTSKFSSLLYLPAAWLLMCVWHLAASGQNPRMLVLELWARRRAVALVGAVAALTVWAVYGFTFGRVDFLHLRVPAPRFFSGIHSVWLHSQSGHPAYLLGQRSLTGFWYYYPTVLVLKTPLGMLMLLCLTPWLMTPLHERHVFAQREHASTRMSTRQTRMSAPRAGLAAAFSAGIVLISMRSHIDGGVRYLLPAYVGFSVVCGCGAAQARGWASKAAVVALIAWQIVSGVLVHPDYLAYTNEITGGHPERYLADSDLDWGQDMKRLEAFLEREHATSVTFAPFNRTYAMAGHATIPMTPGESDHPSPGWNAVSITIWKVFGYPSWADRIPPQRRIGRSILLWYF